MSSNVTSAMSPLLAPYNPNKINAELPDKHQLMLDAQSPLSQEQLADKATQQFTSLNASTNSCQRLLNHIEKRLTEVINPHQKSLNNKTHNTDKFHTRLVPKDQTKRTVMTKVTFTTVAVAAFATPMIAWFAMSNYLIGSGIFPDFYEYWWKSFLFSFLGVSSTFIFKFYEDRVLKSDEEKRRFIKRFIWLATAIIILWIGLFSALFGFAETGLLEESAYESLAAWSFTTFHLIGETITGFLIWNYAIHINNKNKVLETEMNAEYLRAEELEELYSADQVELIGCLNKLTDYIERYESGKSVYVANYLAQVSLHRNQISVMQNQATFNYINDQQNKHGRTSGPRLVHGG